VVLRAVALRPVAFFRPVVFLAAAFFFPLALAGLGAIFGSARADLPLTTSLKVELAPKRTPLEAAIFTGAPVCGLRPVRAARRVGLKLPKPTTATRRPLLTSLMIVWTNALTASSASRFASEVDLLTASISSDLFTATS
jgi:putative acetyltransferase